MRKRCIFFVVDLKRGNISIVYLQSGKYNDLFVWFAFLKHPILTVPAMGVGCFFPDLTNSIVLQESNHCNQTVIAINDNVYHHSYRDSPLKVVDVLFLLLVIEKFPTENYLKNISSLPTCSSLLIQAFTHLKDLDLILFSTTLIPPFPILQQLPLTQDVVFWVAPIIGCLLLTHRVVWSLILPALS